jgi:VanZ family protein
MSRSRHGTLLLVYALIVAYASTVIGVVGLNFVPIGWDEAVHRFIQTQYVANDSTQRSDWMGNLVMAVPLGFLAAGWIPGGRFMGIRWGAVAAFVLCGAFIVAVKFAQLYFPPRTVTLNYIVAQSIGALCGIVLYEVLRSPLATFGTVSSRLETLRMVLRVYTGLVIAFMLMPLDFALNAEDLTAQLDKLPNTFVNFSGEGRPVVVRVALAAASIVATAPIGALLTLMDRGRIYVGRSIRSATGIGFCVMLGVYAATTLVISGAASLPSVGFRTIGIALGAWFMHWLTRQDPDELRYDLGDLVPWALPIYLVTLFAVNGLLSLDWIAPSTAATDFYDLGLLPLFNYYIVTKAQAAKNIVGHVVMYAPIGVMIWLRARDDGGRAKAFILAAILSAIVETGRFLRPGLVPDINAIPLAGVAAWAAVAFMPVLWRLLGPVAIGRSLAFALQLSPDAGPGVSWRDRDLARRTRRRNRTKAIGDVEDY